MRTFLYQWVKANIIMLVNAGALVGTDAVSLALGFVYWWFAARQFPPEIVGLAAAAISVMMLLGGISILGLGTLLMGELPRQPGKEGSLISAALMVVGGVGGGVGIMFALVAPFVSANFQVLRASGKDVVLFAIGVSLFAIASVVDDAVVGLLQSMLLLWRNALFVVAKLVALFVVSLWLSHATGLTIYATWVIGNALSLVALAGFVVLKRGWSVRSCLPQWGLLRKLGPVALQHYITNLILQAPNLLLPVLVTALLSASANAWFYVSWMVASCAISVTYALTLILYAMSSAEPAALAHKMRSTLSLALVTCMLANCLLLFGTKQILGLFGHTYVEQATWSLHILGLGAFPFIIKSHYIAACRVQGRLAHAMLLIAAGAFLELGGAALGAHLGGLLGLSIGFDVAECVESLLMVRTVYKAVRPATTSTIEINQSGTLHTTTVRS
jgi:O-antigen/teichoic acid export membrane protein